MMRGHVAFLISNEYGPDVRVQKEAHTLAAAGWRVTVIAWDRSIRLPQSELENVPEALKRALADWPGRTFDIWSPITVVRIHVPAGYHTGRRLLARIPRFWWRACHELRRIQPTVVHAHDLDTLPLAWWYGRLTRVPVVYDAREYYPGMVQASVGRSLSAALEHLERMLAPRVDAVLTVSSRLETRLIGMGARVTLIPNTQSLYDADWIARAREDLRAQWGLADDDLVLVNVGQLAPDRLLAPVLEAVAGERDVWLVIGGTGPGEAEVRRAAAACPRIRYVGRVQLQHVAALVAASDIVYYGLNADNPNSAYFMPNLAFFALAVGRPLLVTPVGEIAEFVERAGCGFVMESATGAAAAQALRSVRDGAVREALAQRARILGETRYNWTYTASDLLRVHECLGDVRNCM